jgi:pantothenate kinase
VVLEPVIDLAAAVSRARDLAAQPGRAILGITGPPGCGKSTLAEVLCERVGDAAAMVPMDGFHLADVVLDSLGLRARKGAPETFDGFGYAALLARLRANTDPVVYAPAFERDLEQPIAGALAIPRGVRLVVTEGNYLLHDGPGWPVARACLDAVWYVDADDELRLQRLTARHVRFGKSAAEAEAWIASVDAPNADLIAAGRVRADAVVEIP